MCGRLENACKCTSNILFFPCELERLKRNTTNLFRAKINNLWEKINYPYTDHSGRKNKMSNPLCFA